MIRLLLFALLLQMPSEEWISVETYDVITSIDFSPIEGDDTVTSTYTIHILEDQLPAGQNAIACFKIEVALKSGYTITNVTDKWGREEVESASGSAKLKAVKLNVILEGWDYWDVEIFRVSVWYKIKDGWGKRI